MYNFEVHMPNVPYTVNIWQGKFGKPWIQVKAFSKENSANERQLVCICKCIFNVEYWQGNYW